MDKITQFAINNPRATILVLFFITLVGIQTFLTMPSQEDPEITIRNAQVTAYFAGMPTDQIENLLAKPLEKKIKDLKKQLKSFEHKIIGEKKQGIYRKPDTMNSHIYNVRSFLGHTLSPPTPNQELQMNITTKAIEEFMTEYEAFKNGDFENFKKEVLSLGIGIF